MLHDEKMRNLSCKRLEVDEIWQFIGKKSKHATDEEKENHIGDAWTFVAIDSDTKLVPAYRTGHRSAEMTHAFMKDVASRLANRVQLTSDGFITYAAAVDDAFGAEGVDYAQLHKTYEGDAFGPRKYSPPQITGIAKKPIFGIARGDARLDELRRTEQPQHPHGEPPLHAPDERVLEEAGEPRRGDRAPLRAPQFRPDPPEPSRDPGDGGGHRDDGLERGGSSRRGVRAE